MRRIAFWAVLGLATVAGCATAPKTVGERDALEDQADATLDAMLARDPGLRGMLEDVAGYAVFPSIGEAGVVAGAAYGRGILYENGRKTGFVELNQGSIGLQLGAQTFSELVVLRTPTEVQRMKKGDFSIGAEVSAVVLTAGAAANAGFDSGVAVFVLPRGGLMAGLSVNGQLINYQPRNPPQG